MMILSCWKHWKIVLIMLIILPWFKMIKVDFFSENNYVSSLQRLVSEYRKPLEETQPPILSQAKVKSTHHAHWTLMMIVRMMMMTLVTIRISVYSPNPPPNRWPIIIMIIQVATLFHGLATILGCHMRLRASLTTAVSKWDKVGFPLWSVFRNNP